MGSEVLGLIDDEENIGERPAPNVGKWLDDQFFLIDQLGDFLVFLVRLLVLILDELQVVPKRLHVGVELGLDVTW